MTAPHPLVQTPVQPRDGLSTVLQQVFHIAAMPPDQVVRVKLHMSCLTTCSDGYGQRMHLEEIVLIERLKSWEEPC